MNAEKTTLETIRKLSEQADGIKKTLRELRREMNMLRAAVHTNRYLQAHHHERCPRDRRRIWDCFTFFNELELLEIRLHTLDPVVDRFVLVEATRTHSGKPKPLYFQENKALFERFASKIVHVIVDEYPEFETTWSYENHQRNGIMQGLEECCLNDIVMISDLDEIPCPDAVTLCKELDGVTVLRQKFYYYYLNYQKQENPYWDQGTRVLTFSELVTWFDRHESDYHGCNLRSVNDGSTPNQIRFIKGRLLENGGWHFSYLGGIERVMHKIDSYAHQEHNNDRFNTVANIGRAVETGTDHMGLGFKFQAVELDDTFPRYILDNREKFSHLIREI